MFVEFVKLELVVGRVGSLARRVVTVIVSRANVALLVTLQSHVREIARLVRTKIALESAPRLVVVHHVLL